MTRNHYIARFLGPRVRQISTEPKRVFVLFFLAAFAIRVPVIIATPSLNNWIDLSIYMDGADLMRHGVNPYAFNDSPALRTALRKDPIAWNEYTSTDQALWNYYAAGNPPLSLVFYRAVAAVSFKPLAYRIAFAVVDSVLAGAIALFILRFWGAEWTRFTLGSALLLGAVSPVLLKWGLLFPEDKGLEILLMLLAVYLAKSPSRIRSFYLSALVLGCSIAFKLLGAFLIPVCLKYAVYERSESSDAGRTVDAWKYLLLAGSACLVWFVPFFPQVVPTMFGRFQATTGPALPMHGSPWRFVFQLLPNGWDVVRLLAVSALTLFVGLGFWKRRLSTEATAVGLLVVFVCLLLIAGSMDRMNMALVPAVLILGCESRKWGLRLVTIYALAGSIAAVHYPLLILAHSSKLQSSPWNDGELSDALLTAAMVVAIFGALLAQFLSSRPGVGFRCEGPPSIRSKI